MQGSSAPNPPLKQLSLSWSQQPREMWREQMPCPAQPLLLCSCRMGDAQQLLDPLRKPGLQSRDLDFPAWANGIYPSKQHQESGTFCSPVFLVSRLNWCFSKPQFFTKCSQHCLWEVLDLRDNGWGTVSLSLWAPLQPPLHFDWRKEKKTTSWWENIQPCVLGSLMDRALLHMVLFQSCPYCWEWGNETKNSFCGISTSNGLGLPSPVDGLCQLIFLPCG